MGGHDDPVLAADLQHLPSDDDAGQGLNDVFTQQSAINLLAHRGVFHHALVGPLVPALVARGLFEVGVLEGHAVG